ncbi:MAG TPA: alpha/beta hydrolase-fold protein [Gemmatimonadaceae bacterium]
MVQVTVESMMRPAMQRSLAILILAVAAAPAAAQSAVPVACSASSQSSSHLRILERWIDDVWGRGRTDLVEELVRPVYVRHELDSTRTVTAAAYAAEISAVRRALPGVRFDIHDCAAIGDRLWVRWTMTGVSAATGATVRRMGMQAYRIEAGKLAETWMLMPPTDATWPENATSGATLPAVPTVRTDRPSGPAEQPSNVVLADAHTFVIRDPETQVPYRIYLALPHGYTEGSKRYRTLYVLDADATFALATQAYRLLRVDPAMPDLLLVGIGYDLEGAARRSRRNQDLTPTRLVSDTATGQGAAFLRSLANVIVPAVDSLYRTDRSDRAIFGHSLGALFALYALFERPELFQRYVVSSPSLWWDDAVVLRYERRFAERARNLPGSIFMAVGSEEPADMRAWFQPFADSLASRRYPDLRFTAVVLPNETHLSAPATAFTRGLRTIYR